MANRFNTPIASQAISAYAPVDMNVLLNELQMVQKRWDENESFGEQVKKTIEAIPAMPGDVPFRDQLVSSLTNELNKAVSEETDLGSSSFKRKIESIYNKYSTNADVKTLVSNHALYNEKQKKKEIYEKDGRYTPELDIDNQSTRIDKNGKLIPYNYQLERAFSDDEYLNPIAKFGNQLKASSQSGRNFVIDEMGNKYTFDFSGKGITKDQVRKLGENFAVSYLNTDVGRQRLKRYITRTGGNQKAAVQMFRNDIISYLEGNVFSETSSGKDFDFAPQYVAKRLQEKQISSGTTIAVGDYEEDNGTLAEDSPEFQQALANLAKTKGVSVNEIDKKDFINALNGMRNGMRGGAVVTSSTKQMDKITNTLFPDNQTPYLTEQSFVKKGTSLVKMSSKDIEKISKGDYVFNVIGVDPYSSKIPGAIVVSATHKDGKQEPITFYMKNQLANEKTVEAADMLGIINSAAMSPVGKSLSVEGRKFRGENNQEFVAPPGTIMNIRTIYTNPTATSRGSAQQYAELVLNRLNSQGKPITQKVKLDIKDLQKYFGSKLIEGMAPEDPADEE
ncbi:MAG: hypothetical protein EBU90_01600 [Proteobacteria bacterium]|nr:hypothetical protein [Pseudomonadota bacterium]